MSAVEKVRSVNRQMQGDIWVYLRGGTYALEEALEFGPEDSGSGDFFVSYRAFPGETPFVSGGRTITGWSQMAGSAIWQAVSSVDIDTRQLYIGGRRAVRAREPASILGVLTKTTSGYTTPNRTLLTWRNPDVLEFVYTGIPDAGSNWTESRCGVSGVQDLGDRVAIQMKEPCWTNATVNKEDQAVRTPTTVENGYELLNSPGEWYYDKTSRTFYYLPRETEDLRRDEVIAPVLDVLVTGRGAGSSPVRNIQFFGITFAYATWLRTSGPDGFVEIQANFALVGNPPVGQTLPANISFQNARNIRFERNTFIHLGAAGMSLAGGSQDNAVVGNVFNDISGTALRIGDVTTPMAPDDEQDRRNWVVDNYVDGIAVEYHGGVGIHAGYVAQTMVSHNEVANVPYSAISLGWGWGAQSYAESNEVAYNDLHDHMQLLVDGGGVYTLSPQGGAAGNWSSVHDNHIHSQRNNWGALYFDEGSAYIDAYRNAIEEVPVWLFIWTSSIHDITVHDNFSQTSAFRNDGTRITLSNNSIVSSWPAQAQAIADGAGVEPAYQDIKNKIRN